MCSKKSEEKFGGILNILYFKQSYSLLGKTFNPRKPMSWIAIDSLVIGIIAMVATMPADIPTFQQCWVMLKAFLGAFILQVAIERGIKKEPK